MHEERYRLIGGYSTGMKQRVKLAQALVHDPKLLLLDEPTNGLDPEGREDMLELISRTGREFGIAVIVTSHLLGEIERVCDHLIAIDAGRLQFAGPVSEFTQRTERVLVELDDDVPAFAERLRAAGIGVEGTGMRLHLAMRDDSGYDVVRDIAAELGAPLARIEVTRRRLEDLFRAPSAS
jgi:ABC-2 type transport system ATP-binding protein